MSVKVPRPPVWAAFLLFLAVPGVGFSWQQPTSDPATLVTPAERPERPQKRVFGIIPNYRTSPLPVPYVPLSTHEKFSIATQDAFDRGTFILAAAFGGEAQLANSNPSFGHGPQAFAKYYGASLGDYFIGDYMTEAVFPTLFRQDPRYFRRAKGTVLSRLGYAAGQIFWTHSDQGMGQFNYSELVGNSAAVGISNIYYKDNRDASDAVSKLGNQIGVDMASNILKEFWPDILRKMSRHH